MIKKTYTVIFLIVLVQFNQPGFSQPSPGEEFRKGIEMYSSGNYTGAVDIWTGLYKSGYRSAELNFNIGNAFFKLNNIPGSILFYERAKLMAPADEDISYNLNIARTLVVDRFDEIPQLFFVEWYNFLALALSSDTWAWTSIITFIICLLSFSLYLYSSKYKLKVAGFWIALLLIILSASSLALTFRNKELVHDSKKAVIFSPVVNGKSSPDLSGTDLFLLHEGTRVTIEDEVGEWFEVELSDGNKGWIPSGSLEII